jgi:hypothetical protein
MTKNKERHDLAHDKKIRQAKIELHKKTGEMNISSFIRL